MCVSTHILKKVLKIKMYMCVFHSATLIVSHCEPKDVQGSHASRRTPKIFALESAAVLLESGAMNKH